MRNLNANPDHVHVPDTQYIKGYNILPASSLIVDLLKVEL